MSPAVAKKDLSWSQQKKMVLFIHILNFLRPKLDCGVMIQRTKHRIIRYNGGKEAHPHVQEYFIF